MTTYSIKEIYYTLQGEGIQAGRPAIFCRFAGCNLWSGLEKDRFGAQCTFCDTDFLGTDGENGGKFETASKLARHANKFWPDATTKKFIVLTGGEPMLQVDSSLIFELHSLNFEIAIETNGTIICPPEIDWICVSPKAGTKISQKTGNELKVIYPQPGLNFSKLLTLSFEYFLIQPMDGPNAKENTEASVDFCKENPSWRLSLQTHKQLGLK